MVDDSHFVRPYDVYIIGRAPVPDHVKNLVLHFEEDDEIQEGSDYEIQHSIKIGDTVSKTFVDFVQPYITDPQWKELLPYSRVRRVKRIHPGEILEWHKEEEDDETLLGFMVLYLIESPSAEFSGRELAWIDEEGDFHAIKPEDGLMLSIGSKVLHGIPTPLSEGNIVSVGFRFTEEGYQRWKSGKKEDCYTTPGTKT